MLELPYLEVTNRSYLSSWAPTGIAAEGLNSDFEEKLDGIIKRESNMLIGNFPAGGLLQQRSTKGLFITEATPQLKLRGDFFL